MVPDEDPASEQFQRPFAERFLNRVHKFDSCRGHLDLDFGTKAAAYRSQGVGDQ
jgi:hypothetical protein